VSLRNLGNVTLFVLKRTRYALSMYWNIYYSSFGEWSDAAKWKFPGWLRPKYVYTARVQTSRSCVKDGLRTHPNTLLQKCLLFDVKVRLKMLLKWEKKMWKNIQNFLVRSRGGYLTRFVQNTNRTLGDNITLESAIQFKVLYILVTLDSKSKLQNVGWALYENHTMRFNLHFWILIKTIFKRRYNL